MSLDVYLEVRTEVFTDNVTHNLNEMATEACLYSVLWRPEELDIEFANELITPLQKGLDLLLANPEQFKKFNPVNGWGDYEGLVEFVRNYLDACRQFPNANVRVWR